MARPCKRRHIRVSPGATQYKPVGVPVRELQQAILRLDEFEAVRLVDGESLAHDAAARRMGVSRPTVTRILARGRATIARALTAGQALLIEGGPVAPVSPRCGRRRQAGCCERHKA